MATKDSNTTLVYPVILCGGSGTRLWPLSRESYPKQFVKLFGENEPSLFQQTVLRLGGAGYTPPLVVANDAFRFIVAEQLRNIDADHERLIIEPVARNTAPAILAAAIYLEEHAPGATMLVAPSDHLIPDKAAFDDIVFRAAAETPPQALTTFGVKPTRPETGYGYLEVDSEQAETSLVALRRFVEKPDARTAEEFVESGRHLWNAGIFLMRADTVIQAFKKLAPDVYAAVAASCKKSHSDLDFLRLEQGAFEKSPSISFDYAIMEKSDQLFAAPSNFEWSDLGAWDAVWRSAQKTENNNVIDGDVLAIDCEASLFRSEKNGPQLVGIGLSDMIVVAMKDAVMVAPQSEVQRVKEAVATLQAQKVPASRSLPRDYRPWGWYECLAMSDRFQVKRIVVKPGECLSLQSHFHRSEHWIVVEGTARVTVDEDATLIPENGSAYIPLGAVHRLENPGKLPLTLIEIQTGPYLGEDDIVRYEDRYARID